MKVMWTCVGLPFQVYVGTHHLGEAELMLITLEYLPQFQRWLVRTKEKNLLIDQISFYNPATDTMSHTPYE